MGLRAKQDLAMEVLAARYRLGETIWTFEKCHTSTLRELESLGLVNLMHGIVEKTVRASLTEAGRSLCLDANYSPPGINRGVMLGKMTDPYRRPAPATREGETDGM